MVVHQIRYDYAMQTIPLHFYDERIEVIFDVPPTYEKSPPCPQGFLWRGGEFTITETLEEWLDFDRRGKAARNMQPAHLASAKLKGSWGVGRFYFRVMTTDRRIFDLYFDRAPEDCDDRKGKWVLLGERKNVELEK